LNLKEESNIDKAIADLKGTIDDDLPSQEIKETLDDVRTEFNIPDEEVILLFVSACFTKGSYKKKSIEKYSELFEDLIGDEEPEIGQMRIVEAFECLCTTRSSLCKYFPLFLSQLYSESLVTADVLFQWKSMIADNEEKSEILEQADKFIKNISSSDSESEDV